MAKACEDERICIEQCSVKVEEDSLWCHDVFLCLVDNRREQQGLACLVRTNQWRGIPDFSRMNALISSMTSSAWGKHARCVDVAVSQLPHRLTPVGLGASRLDVAMVRQAGRAK